MPVPKNQKDPANTEQALTVCLHLFILLLTSRLDRENRLNLSTAEIRTSLEASLDNMKMLERTSLMTYKARKCLVKLLEAFDILGEYLFHITSSCTCCSTGGKSICTHA